MSKLSQKLADRLARAARGETMNMGDKEEGWAIVAETIELMIDKAIHQSERERIAFEPPRWTGPKGPGPVPQKVSDALNVLAAADDGAQTK